MDRIHPCGENLRDLVARSKGGRVCGTRLEAKSGKVQVWIDNAAERRHGSPDCDRGSRIVETWKQIQATSQPSPSRYTRHQFLKRRTAESNGEGAGSLNPLTYLSKCLPHATHSRR